MRVCSPRGRGLWSRMKRCCCCGRGLRQWSRRRQRSGVRLLRVQCLLPARHRTRLAAAATPAARYMLLYLLRQEPEYYCGCVLIHLYTRDKSLERLRTRIDEPASMFPHATATVCVLMLLLYIYRSATRASRDCAHASRSCRRKSSRQKFARRCGLRPHT